VTLTNIFLEKAEELISPIRIKNEWDIFSVYARQRHAGTMCKLACTLDDIAYGKNTYSVKHDDFATLCVGATVALERTPKLAESFLKEIEIRIEADSHQPKIRKNFPDFVRTPASISAILMEYKGLSGTLLSMLALSNWLDSEELVKDVLEIARHTDLLRIAYEATRIYGKLKTRKTLLEEDRQGLQFLRNIAERQVLVATMATIPYVPNKFEKSDKTLSALIAYILRFAVKEDLNRLIAQSTKATTFLHKDLVDFFVDYPQGDVRKKGLRNFASQCKKYALLTAKE